MGRGPMMALESGDGSGNWAPANDRAGAIFLTDPFAEGFEEGAFYLAEP